MRKECKLAVVLLFILLVFGACSETQSKVDNVNKNENRASSTTAPGMKQRTSRHWNRNQVKV